MSNIFQQVIDHVKQAIGDTGHFDNLLISGEAQRLLNEGLVAHHGGDYSEAIRIYSEILERHPQYHITRHNRCVAYIIVRDFDSALTDAEYLIQHNPLNINYVLLRGEVHKNIGHYQVAMNDFNHVIESHQSSDKWRAYYLRAVTARLMSNLPQAIYDYTYLIVLNEKPEELYDLYSRRGHVYELLDDLDKALNDYLQAVKHRHNYAYGHVGCANVYLRLKDFDKAIEYNSKALKLEPDVIEYQIQRSQILMRIAQYQDAIDICKTILESNPDHYPTHNTIAFYYQHIDKLDKAMHHATIAIERSEPKGAYFDTRAQIHWLNGDFEKALQDFETAHEIDPAGLYLMGQAITYFTMNENRRAITCLKDAIKLDATLSDVARIEEDYQYAPAYVQAGRDLMKLLDDNA